MIIDEMHVEKFRDIENTIFKLGEKLTFIAGSNGTSKTSLLGLIGQPFAFREEGNVIKYRTITGKEFSTKFEDIHNFTNYDDITSIKYKLKLCDGFSEPEIPVAGEYRDKSNKEGQRFVAFPSQREKGKGNYKIPVLYFGLKRLHPLGEHGEKDVTISENLTVTTQEVDKFNYYHRELFINHDSDFNVEDVKTSNKQMLGGRNEKYDSNGFSAGQDNISQLITSFLSFKRLKDELGEAYQGGILLIDEIEATLHPLTQEKLFETLYKVARDLKLQIVVTTHSLEIIKLAMNSKYRNDTEIVYLTKTKGCLECFQKPSFDLIHQDMTASALQKKTYKIQVLCEDNEAVSFLTAILPSDTFKKIDLISTELGHGNLENLARSPLATKNDFIFVLDGDQDVKRRSNVLSLPGGASPEAIIYDFLTTLPLDDNFFERPYTKDFYFRTYPNRPTNRDQFKAYFADLKERKPRVWSLLFHRWIKSNQIEVNAFIAKFESVLDKVYPVI